MEVLPATMDHLESYKDFLLACLDSGIKKYKTPLQDPKSYLEKIVSHTIEDFLPEDWPKTSTFFCIENDEILGVIRVRHGTTPYIERVVGHVGYETKPTARGKGVAKLMLSWLQQNIISQTVIITCESNNIASRKVIESCSGKFINEIYSHEKNAEVMRYQLPGFKKESK